MQAPVQQIRKRKVKGAMKNWHRIVHRNAPARNGVGFAAINAVGNRSLNSKIIARHPLARMRIRKQCGIMAPVGLKFTTQR